MYKEEDYKLVKQLRRMSPQLDILQCECVLQAADRIEAQEAALRKIAEAHSIDGANAIARAALLLEEDKQ